MASPDFDDGRASRRWAWTVAAAMLAIFGGLVAWITLVAAPRERREVVEGWTAELAAMADDRAGAIDRWLYERLGDARVLGQTRALRELVAAEAGITAAAPPAPAVFRAVVGGYDYRDAYLLGSRLQTLAETGPDRDLAPTGLDLPRRVLASGRPELGISLDAAGKPQLQFAAPVTPAGAERPRGVVLLAADPGDWLYPYLLHPTLASPSLETVLVRRDGSDALFLSPLRGRPTPPLTYRRPLDQPAFAAAAALAGRTGSAENTDYRGTQVLAATRLLTVAPWGLVTKVDLAEAMRPYRTWLRGMLLFTAAFAAALTGAGFGLAERHRRIVRQLATEGERRLGELVQEAADAVFVVALDGRILQASRRADAMYGYSQDELLGLTLADIRVEGERERLRSALAAAQAGAFVMQDTVHLRRDGTEFPVEVSTRRVTSQGATYLLDIARDVSDRKSAEEAWRASEAKYRQTLDGMLEGCQLIGHDWAYLYVNESAARHGRATREALLGHRIMDVYPGFEETKAFEAMRRCMESRQPTKLENEFVYPDGGRAWFDLSIQPAPEGIFVLSVDVTDRRTAETQLRTASARLQRIFSSNMMGIVVADADGGLLEVNDYYLDLLGFTRAEFENGQIRWDERTPPEHLPADRRAIDELRERGVCAPYEKEYVCKDGSRVWVQLTDAMILEPEERILAFVLDITARKRAEQEREVTMRLLRAANSAAGLHELMQEATGVLHEWYGCEAVGIRLHDGDDFPYFETRGFPAEFVEAERSLCLRASDGTARRGADGNPILECMCGNVLSSRFNPAKPFFTARGSFWTNSTTKLLARTSEADRQARTRNRCNGEGYESVALVALRLGDTTYGLLQLNDKRTDRFTPERIELLERLADNLAINVAHRLSQRSLAESEDRYRFLFANMQEGYAHCRMAHDDGRPLDFVYLDVNESFARLTGLKDVVGRRASDLVPGGFDSNPELIEAYGRVAETGTPARFEAYLERTGTWFSVSAYSPAPGHFVAVFDDITDRKRAEDALRESAAAVRAEKAKLEAALASMPDAMFISDTDGHFVDFNDAFATFHRFATKGECAKTLAEYPAFLEVFLADGTPAPLDQWAVPRALRGETATNVEYSLLRKDTGERWAGSYSFSPIVGPEGAIVGSVVVGRDVTDLKATEDALRKSEARYRFLFTNMLEGYAHCRILYEDGRPRDFVYLHVNDAFEKLTGLSGAVGKRVTELIPGIHESNPELLETYARVAETGHPARFESFVAPLAMWFSVSVYSPAREHFVAVFDVINERKHAEETVREARDRLEVRVAERTAALEAANQELESFAYSVSHDLRVPLRAVDGFSRILAEDHAAGLDDEGHRLVGVVREQTARMGQLIDDLLAFSRVGRAEMRSGVVDMSSLAAAAFAELGGSDRGAELVLGELPDADGDAALLHQVWLNLIGNALKFCAPGATPAVDVSGGVAGAEVVYTVRDHGVGFDMRYADKLFGVFQRLHSLREFPGTGVGLALAQRIVHRHGGRIWGEGKVGEGAAFSFALPAARVQEG